MVAKTWYDTKGKYDFTTNLPTGGLSNTDA